MQICARKNRRVRLSAHHRKVRMTLEIEIELERRTNELAGARSRVRQQFFKQLALEQSSCSAHGHGGTGTQHASFHVCVFCVFVVTRNPRQDFILWLIAEWISIQHEAYDFWWLDIARTDRLLFRFFQRAHFVPRSHVIHSAANIAGAFKWLQPVFIGSLVQWFNSQHCIHSICLVLPIVFE